MAPRRTSTARSHGRDRRLPAVPRGWESLEVFPAPVPEPELDMEAELRRDVERQVRAGFLRGRKLVERIVDGWSDQMKPAAIRRIVGPLIDAAVERHRLEQRGWKGPTDCDRLDRTMAELERRGIVARQDYWCCGTCGCAAIDDEMTKLERRKKVRGYTFYHEQDTEAAVEGGSLYLNYGPRVWTPEGAVAIGKEVVRTLRKHGLRVLWNGSVEERIGVRVRWRRRTG